MAWTQLILRSKFKGWSILNLALRKTRWRTIFLNTVTTVWVSNWYHSNYPKEWFILSQIRDSVVVLRDRIHRELGNQTNLIGLIKLGWFND